jgi:hypothetical protein
MGQAVVEEWSTYIGTPEYSTKPPQLCIAMQPRKIKYI